MKAKPNLEDDEDVERQKPPSAPPILQIEKTEAVDDGGYSTVAPILPLVLTDVRLLVKNPNEHTCPMETCKV